MIIKYSFFSLLLILCLSACTKISETEIGTDLIPAIDGVITKDTNLYINTKTWGSTDSISPSLYDDHALGYVNDPLFGITHAAVNLQLLPSSFPVTFEVNSDSLFLDSVVLALNVRGVWGDTNQNLSLHVKELENDVPFANDTISSSTRITTIIYNNTSQLATGNDVTYGGMAASIDPKVWNDSFRVFKDSGVNMIRMRLADDLGNRLLHTYTSGGQYDSVLAFKTAFSGLQVSAEAAGNSLLRIGLANSSSLAGEVNTKLALYYRYNRRDSPGKQDTTVRYFTVSTSSTNGSASAHSNYIQRQYSTGQIAGYYPATQSSNDDYVYIQSAPGTYATLTIDSGIAKLPNWIIHRADIVMEQAPDAASPLLDNYATPFLFLLGRQSESQPFEKDTTKFVIPGFDSTNPATSDALFSSNVLANYSDFGGFPRRGTFGGTPNINYYNFNVSRYVQGIVTNKNKSYKLVLYTPYHEVFQLTKGVINPAIVSSAPVNNAGVGRVKLYGGGSDSTNAHRMKLHIVYSIPH